MGENEVLEETSEKKAEKRPLGLTIIAIFWFLGGLYNLYMSSVGISVDLEAMPYLSTAPAWFQFGVPAELVIFLFVFVIGLVQMFTIYGLWTGKTWSYMLALAIPILSVISWISQTALYQSAPIGYGIQDSINYVALFFSVFWVMIYWYYLRQEHVKKFLGV